MEKKILVIDDELFIRELVQDFLEIEGIACNVAADIEEGLALLNGEAFHLILLDRNLGEMKAEDVLSRLRAIEKDIPIIIMTGDLDVPEECFSKYNISTVVNKPFQYDEFIKVIKKNL